MSQTAYKIEKLPIDSIIEQKSLQGIIDNNYSTACRPPLLILNSFGDILYILLKLV